MDVCRIFLGRPWRYDCRTLHDSYKNTFTFYKDNAKIVLRPTREKIPMKPTLLGDVNIFSDSVCDVETSKDRIIEDADNGNVKDGFLDAPPIFDQYVEDVCHEIN